jgi:hypothetical protein
VQWAIVDTSSIDSTATFTAQGSFAWRLGPCLVPVTSLRDTGALDLSSSFRHRAVAVQWAIVDTSSIDNTATFTAQGSFAWHLGPCLVPVTSLRDTGALDLSSSFRHRAVAVQWAIFDTSSSSNRHRAATLP